MTKIEAARRADRDAYRRAAEVTTTEPSPFRFGTRM